MNIKNIGIGCLFIIVFIVLIMLVPNNDTSQSFSDNDWQMEEIHKLANNIDDYIITFEAAGVILKINSDNANLTLNILVNENLWVNEVSSDNRNTIRYALQRKAQEQGLKDIKITGNSSGVDLT